MTDLEEFCEEIRASIIGGLVRYCGDVDIAEEAFQEAVARTCVAWPEVRRMRTPGAWVWRVAVNVVHDHHRRERVHRRHLAHEHVLPSDGTDGSVSDVVVSLWLAQELDELPEDQRAVLELRYLRDRSIRQVAADLGRPVGTIKSLAHRGANALRARIA